MRRIWGIKFRANPFGTCAAVAAILLGIFGIVLGDRLSQGMAESLRSSATSVAHIWGAVFALGGILNLYGLYQSRSVIEIPGLWLMGGCYAFYCITVIAGLGMHGIAAGTISGALTLGCMAKALMISRAARNVARRSFEDHP